MKEEVLHLLEQAYNEIARFIDRTDDIERRAAGAQEKWAPKDVVAHIAEWARRTASGVDGNEETFFSESDDLDQENAAIFEQNQQKSWEELQAALDKAFFALARQVNTRTETDLRDAGRMEWQRGRPLWRLILGNGYVHPLLHLEYAYLARGEPKEALRLAEESSQSLLELDQSPAWQGDVLYNLACTYALLGERAQALVYLTQALHLQPGLVEWSRRDPDLESLHDDPEYQALYRQ